MEPQPTKVVLVTGGSSGIGEATVILLAKKGYQLSIAGSQEEKITRVCRHCTIASPRGLKPLAVVADFSDPDNAELAVRKTVERFGRLDVLINNAGIFATTRPTNRPDVLTTYRRVMTINTDAAVRATMAAVEHLKKSKGVLLFVSSVAASKPHEFGWAYCMSKASLSILAKCLAVDLAPDVRVNVISPGPIATPIFQRAGMPNEVVNSMTSTTLQGRLGESDDVAKAIAYMISDDANFMHGTELFLDGGYTIRPIHHSKTSNEMTMQARLERYPH